MNPNIRRFLILWPLRLMLTGIVMGVLVIAGVWFYFAPQLPEVDALRDVQLQSPLSIYTSDNKLIATFGEKQRIPTSLDEIPLNLRRAFIASEDDRFYYHPGVDWHGIARAVWELASTGQKGSGGSTITQQLTRGFFLSNEKTYVRKLKEIMLALRIEREISKDEILQLYLNKVFLGHRAYGVAAAAQTYYGKHLDELTIAEMAMIAGIVQRPSRVNPITSPAVAQRRRNYVLGRMLNLGFINQAAYDTAVQSPVNAYRHRTETDVDAPYLAEIARQWALDKYGRGIYESGYKLITTIDSNLQQAANHSVEDGLWAYDRRHGYRGPEAQLDLTQNTDIESWQQSLQTYPTVGNLLAGLVTAADEQFAEVYLADGQTIGLDMSAVEWANPFLSRDSFGPKPTAVNEVIQAGNIIRVRRTAEGSWVLAQTPEAQAALISLDPSNGAIIAMVGGLDYQTSKFNRATQAQRQPGSSFKPFIYAAAIQNGFHPASIINDAPVVFRDGSSAEDWKPQNFSKRFYGPTRLREAMVNSRNLISIRLLDAIGIRPALEYISQFGFDREKLPNNLSMALGAVNLAPIDIAEGYSTLANGGYAVEAFWLVEIRNQQNKVLLAGAPVQLCDRCLVAAEASATVVAPELAPSPLQTSNQSIPTTESASTNDAINEIQDSAPTFLVNESNEHTHGPPLPRYRPRTVPAATTYLVRSMMSSVIKRGTGRKALELGRSDLAGKTGTTNDQRDAWFSGFNNDVVTTVWVGFDDYKPLGRRELGGQAALPIWIDYMRVALEDSIDAPAKLPTGVAQVWIDPETGKLVLPGSPNAIQELVLQEQLSLLQAQREQASPSEQVEDPFDVF